MFQRKILFQQLNSSKAKLRMAASFVIDLSLSYFHPDRQAQQEEGIRRLEQTLFPASRQRLAEGEWLPGYYSARQFFAFGL